MDYSHEPRPFRAGYRDTCLYCGKPIRSRGDAWEHQGLAYRFFRWMRVI